MARLHFVKKARKAHPEAGVEKGDSYYWWEFRFGGVHKSKERPPRSRLTQSAFLSQLWEIEDGIQERFSTAGVDGFEDELQQLQSELEDLLQEQRDALEAMPEHLQESSSSGELLQERIDGLESWIADLGSIEIYPEEEDFEFDDKVQEVVDLTPGLD